MADATEVPANIVAEEAQQEVKAEEKSHEFQPEQTAKVEETIEQENVVKQEEPIKQNPVDGKQENVAKQGETVADVKKEIKNEGAADVKEKEATSGKPTERRYKGPRPNKSKFDPTVLPESDDPEEIRKQVEFYFSESNLSSDKFLFGLVGGKENKPVPLNLIVSFKRMRRFPNKEAVINALKESKELELSGDAGEETVRRKVPLEITQLIPQNKRYGVSGGGQWRETIDFDPAQDRAITRSIYAKGFSEETATTQIDIEKFFEPYGPINAVRLRRTDTKIFKRSVFVEFANEELAQEFMALEKKPTWEDKELLWMTKLAYVEGKIQDIKDGKIKPKNQRGGKQGSGQHKHNGNRNGRDGNDRNGRGGHRGKGGQRNGRGGGRGRGGHNDRRGGDRDNRRSDREGLKKEDNGIPKIKSSVDVAKNESAAAPAQDGAGKRKATDDGAHEVKKPKVENTVV